VDDIRYIHVLNKMCVYSVENAEYTHVINSSNSHYIHPPV